MSNGPFYGKEEFFLKDQSYKSVLLQLIVLFLALLIALLFGGILFLIAKTNPLKAYGVMLWGPLSSKFGITEALIRAVPLLLVGLGISISFRSDILNIGGEGQILLGAIAASACSPWFS